MFGRAVDTSLGNVWARTYLKTIGKKAKRSLNIQEREPNEKQCLITTFWEKLYRHLLKHL